VGHNGEVRSVKKETEESVVCKCPMCGHLHKHVMYWTGRGMPRVYCALHKSLVSRYVNAGELPILRQTRKTPHDD
jgi:uncharacterized Zn finger protein